MNRVEALLSDNDVIALDGAMGTMLMAAGLVQGDPPEEWNQLYPERILAVHQAYIEAGARIILTNSFGGTRFRLKLHALQDQVVELNRAAAAVARQAADVASHPVLVAGSMGPTGEILEPMGSLVYADAVAAFAEQAAGLAAGGADLLWIETMSDLNEVKAAVAGARSICDLPIAATMTFDTHGHTMMGVSPTQAIQALSALGLVAVGANCGTGPDEIEAVVRAMRTVAPQLPLIAKANAGLPHWGDEGLLYDGTPAVMATYAGRVRALGARLIGACCGSSPTHIAAMVAALRSPQPLIDEVAAPAEAATQATAAAPSLRRPRRRTQPPR